MSHGNGDTELISQEMRSGMIKRLARVVAKRIVAMLIENTPSTDAMLTQVFAISQAIEVKMFVERSAASYTILYHQGYETGGQTLESIVNHYFLLHPVSVDVSPPPQASTRGGDTPPSSGGYHNKVTGKIRFREGNQSGESPSRTKKRMALPGANKNNGSISDGSSSPTDAELNRTFENALESSPAVDPKPVKGKKRRNRGRKPLNSRQIWDEINRTFHTLFGRLYISSKQLPTPFNREAETEWIARLGRTAMKAAHYTGVFIVGNTASAFLRDGVLWQNAFLRECCGETGIQDYFRELPRSMYPICKAGMYLLKKHLTTLKGHPVTFNSEFKLKQPTGFKRLTVHCAVTVHCSPQSRLYFVSRSWPMRRRTDRFCISGNVHASTIAIVPYVELPSDGSKNITVAPWSLDPKIRANMFAHLSPEQVNHIEQDYAIPLDFSGGPQNTSRKHSGFVHSRMSMESRRSNGSSIGRLDDDDVVDEVSNISAPGLIKRLNVLPSTGSISPTPYGISAPMAPPPQIVQPRQSPEQFDYPPLSVPHVQHGSHHMYQGSSGSFGQPHNMHGQYTSMQQHFEEQPVPSQFMTPEELCTSEQANLLDQNSTGDLSQVPDMIANHDASFEPYSSNQHERVRTWGSFESYDGLVDGEHLLQIFEGSHDDSLLPMEFNRYQHESTQGQRRLQATQQEQNREMGKFRSSQRNELQAANPMYMDDQVEDDNLLMFTLPDEDFTSSEEPGRRSHPFVEQLRESDNPHADLDAPFETSKRSDIYRGSRCKQM